MTDTSSPTGGRAGTSRSVAQHDAYASSYDRAVHEQGCYLAEVLFGLCWQFVRPGERILDVGIGSGLSAAPFAMAGLRVDGMDFSPAMLEVCRAKGITTDLLQHDVQSTPWPYPSEAFDHAICCGVMHFIADLDGIYVETNRVLRHGGLFAFTTKSPSTTPPTHERYERTTTDGFDVFAHVPSHVAALIDAYGFEPLRELRCFAGQELFSAWVVRKRGDVDDTTR